MSLISMMSISTYYKDKHIYGFCQIGDKAEFIHNSAVDVVCMIGVVLWSSGASDQSATISGGDGCSSWCRDGGI